MDNSPNWTQIVSAVASCATLVLLVVGLLGARSQLDETIRGRRVQLIIDLAKRWNEPLMIDSRKKATAFATPSELRDAIEKEPIEAFYDLALIPDFFEDLGLVVRADPETYAIVEQLFGSVISQTWDRWELTIAWLSSSEVDEQPTMYGNFRDLAGRLDPPDR